MKKRNLIIYVLLGMVLLLPFFYTIYAYTVSYSLIAETWKLRQSLPTRIYDRNGLLIAELYDEYREYTSISDIPDCVKQAFMAAEDSSFFMHTGIDLAGIARAIFVDIASGELRQGGSTITQQLAKQVFAGRERSIRRKLVELFLAREFEKRFTKDQILEMYLNRIYFSHGVYGVSAAASFYFGKPLKDINIAEACVLAGIASAPDRYSPLKNPRNSHDRSQGIMFNLIASGYIGKHEAALQFNTFWQNYIEQCRTRFPEAGIRRENADRAPWFTEYIRRELISMYGEEMVYRGGLTVMTTADLSYQQYADSLLDSSLREQNRRAVWQNTAEIRKIEKMYASLSLGRTAPGEKSRDSDVERTASWNRSFFRDVSDEMSIVSLITGTDTVDEKINSSRNKYDSMMRYSRAEGAIAVIDPSTGGILVLCGGSEFGQSNQLNRAVQSRRQPGSSFKAFVYGAGIESGKITSATAFYDAPITYKGRRDTWKPSNYDKNYSGRVLVRRAFALSLNIVSARIYDIIGGDCIARFASRMTGVPLSRFQKDPTLSLGTTELTPLEMASGFAVYANRGFSVSVHAIREIKDNSGKIIFTIEGKYKKTRIIDEKTAYVMTSMMRDVVDSGTATYAVKKDAGFRFPCAGKTGTNTDFRDAWFIGFTPDIVAAVWIGCESPEFSLGSGESGAVCAAPVWGRFMAFVYSGKKSTSFQSRPSGLNVQYVCSVTGKIPERNCPSRMEYFLPGTGPSEKCDGLHGKLSNIKELISRDKKSGKQREAPGLFESDEDLQNTEDEVIINEQE